MFEGVRSPLDEVWGVGLCLLAKAVGLLLAAEAGEAAAELVEEEEGVRFAKAAFEGFAVADGEAVVPKDAFGRGRSFAQRGRCRCNGLCVNGRSGGWGGVGRSARGGRS